MLFVMGDQKIVVDPDGVKIEVSNQVWSIWNKYRQNSIWAKEACGILIGGYDKQNKVIYVEQCTKPLRGDRRRRKSYTIRDHGHQKIVDEVYLKSGGTSFYLGTWHTHPEPDPSPSAIDQADWQKCINRNLNIPVLLFVIVGTKSILLSPGGNIHNGFSIV